MCTERLTGLLLILKYTYLFAKAAHHQLLTTQVTRTVAILFKLSRAVLFQTDVLGMILVVSNHNEFLINLILDSAISLKHNEKWHDLYTKVKSIVCNKRLK